MGSDGASVQTVTTPISGRYPAEDWRENHAYDNGGLVVTPMENTYEYVEAKMNMRRQLPFPNWASAFGSFLSKTKRDRSLQKKYLFFGIVEKKNSISN